MQLKLTMKKGHVPSEIMSKIKNNEFDFWSYDQESGLLSSNLSKGSLCGQYSRFQMATFEYQLMFIPTGDGDILGDSLMVMLFNDLINGFGDIIGKMEIDFNNN